MINGTCSRSAKSTLGVLVAVAAVVAACSSGSGGATATQNPVSTSGPVSTVAPASVGPASASASSSAVDVCTLLPADQVAQVTGLAISGTESRTSELIPNDVGCTYGESKVVIDVVTVGGAAQYAAQIAQYGDNAKPIASFGDKAFQDSTDIGPDVVALVGDRQFDAFINPLQQLPANADLTALEEKLITALEANVQ